MNVARARCARGPKRGLEPVCAQGAGVGEVLSQEAEHAYVESGNSNDKASPRGTARGPATELETRLPCPQQMTTLFLVSFT